MRPGILIGILAALQAFGPAELRAEVLSEKEKKRKELNAKFDRLNLRQKRGFVVEKSKAFLKAPEKPEVTGEFDNAKAVPTVKLQILPGLVPEYFSGQDQSGAHCIVDTLQDVSDALLAELVGDRISR